MRLGRPGRLPIILIAGVILALILVFLLAGPPRLLARTETPEFCSSCHVMQAQFEAWFHEGAHRSIQCVDCHLPHQNLGLYYIWKSIDGAKDAIVFYSGTTPDNIDISRKGQDFLQGNCIRCHATTVAKIDQDRRCWDCHRRLSHVRSGAVMVR